MSQIGGEFFAFFSLPIPLILPYGTRGVNRYWLITIIGIFTSTKANGTLTAPLDDSLHQPVGQTL